MKKAKAETPAMKKAKAATPAPKTAKAPLNQNERHKALVEGFCEVFFPKASKKILKKKSKTDKV